MKPFYLTIDDGGWKPKPYYWTLSNKDLFIHSNIDYKSAKSCRANARKVIKELGLKVVEEIEG